MFSECDPIMPGVLDAVVGLSGTLMGCWTIAGVSFNNKLLLSPMADVEDDGIGVDTGLELVLLFAPPPPPPPVELLVADDNEFPEAADDGVDDCCCCCCCCCWNCVSTVRCVDCGSELPELLGATENTKSYSPSPCYIISHNI